MNQKQISVKIIANTFLSNPSVNVVIGKGGNRQKKITRMAEYAYIKALNRDGVFISSNHKGAALFFRSDKNPFSLQETYREIKFAASLPVSKVVQTLKREAFLKKHRYQGTHYYFWFLGVEKGGDKAVFELRDIVQKKATEDKLPILLETSVYRNVRAYQRYGFKTYYTWDDKPNNIKVWFMKWEPN